MASLFTPSGGLTYHLRAFRSHKTSWADFRKALLAMQKNWLQTLSSEQKQNLILVGASGGYNQSPSFLSLFSHIVHIDIDPLAALIFKRRFSSLSVESLQQSVFSSQGGLESELLSRFTSSDSSWMWCNLLGQVGLHHTEKESLQIFQSVRKAMSDYSWFSFHDLYSVRMKKPVELESWPLQFDQWEEAQKQLQKTSGWSQEIEVTDHLTRDQFSFSQSQLLVWPLTPKQLHFVECGFISDGAKSP